MLATLAGEDWSGRARPVEVALVRAREEIVIHSNSRYRATRRRCRRAIDNWHLVITASENATALGDWQTLHLYGASSSRWFADVNPQLESRLRSIAEAAWAGGIRRMTVAFRGPGGLSSHDLLALAAELAAWQRQQPQAPR